MDFLTPTISVSQVNDYSPENQDDAGMVALPGGGFVDVAGSGGVSGHDILWGNSKALNGKPITEAPDGKDKIFGGTGRHSQG